MLNFLPESEIRVLRRRYAARLAAAAAFTLSLGVFAYGLDVTPATVAAWQSADAISAKVAALRESAENRQFEETLGAAQLLREDTQAVSLALAPTVSAALDAVLAKSQSSIAIASIELRRAGTSTVVAVVNGVAATREDLLSFTAELDRDPQIDAALPVSDLAKEKSAPFTLEAAVHSEAQ